MREPEHTVNQNGKSFYRNYYIYEVLITATYLNCTAAVGPKIEQFFQALTRLTWLIHTSVFTLKMESVSKNTIFGLKVMVKSGLEKFILKSLHAGR